MPIVHTSEDSTPICGDFSPWGTVVRMKRSIAYVVVIAFVAFGISAGPAHAQAPRSVVMHVEGPGSTDLRDALASALPDGLRADDAGGFSTALGKNVGKSLHGNKKAKKKARAAIVKAAKKSGAAAAVVAISKEGKRGKRTVTLVVVDGKSGAVLLDRDVAADQAPAAAARALEKLAGGAEAPVAAAPAEPERAEPVAAAAPEPEDDSDAASGSGGAVDGGASDGVSASAGGAPGRDRGALLVLSAGAQIGGRRLAYNDQLTSNMRPYELFGAPLAVVGLQVFPLVSSGGFLGRLGLTAGYAQAFALSSTTESGMSADTSWSRLDLGVQARFGGHGKTGAGVGLGFTKLVFELGNPEMSDDLLPGVDYSALRVGGDVRVPSGKLAVTLSGAYLLVLDDGGVGDAFADASTGGVDLGLGVGYRLSSSLEARVDLGYTRVFYTLNPTPGDLYVAGGALDEFFALGLGVAYAY